VYKKLTRALGLHSLVKWGKKIIIYIQVTNSLVRLE